METASQFELLKKKNIILILIGGDGTCSQKDDVTSLDMPYLSGPDICKISQSFGCPQDYNSKDKPCLSRWEYFRNLLDYCLKKNTVPKLLSYLFLPSNFEKKLKNVLLDEREDIYQQRVNSVIDRINYELYLSDRKLVKTGDTFTICETKNNAVLELPTIDKPINEKVAEFKERALADLEAGNLDSALTKARTTLETTLQTILSRNGEELKRNESISKTFNRVRCVLLIKADKDIDDRICKLVDGLCKIVDSVTEMRNLCGDAHGHATETHIYNLEKHHARLVVNSSITVCEFLLASNEKHERQSPTF